MEAGFHGDRRGREGERDDEHPPPLRRRLVIVNERGLHARAAAKFAAAAGAGRASVTVSKDGTSVCGHSIMGLMMLAAGRGAEIEVEVRGPGAAGLLDALAGLVEGRFDER